VNTFSDTSATALWAKRLHLDVPLLLGLLLLSAVGLVTLYSAGGQNMDVVLRQLARLGIGFSVMLAVAQIPPSALRRWTPWFYGIGLTALVTVLLAGVIGKGAQRWLELGVLRFQPSELMKVAVPAMVAWYFAEKPLPPRLPQVFWAVMLFLVPFALVAKQPDLGTALLIGSAGVTALLFAGIRWRLVGYAFLAFIPTAVLAWLYALHDYQRQRIVTFLDAESDPLGAGYHIIQSKIAIGSGGVYGKGWLNGTQSHLEFLPERHTDFIFAVFGEEFGLLGAVLLLTIYFFVISRGLYIAINAQDTFRRLLAGSLTISLLVYVFVNIGMVSGILPVVGVPLPLLSYGGSSLVTLMTGFGILMSIQTHRKLVNT
jgi:rod shape determining protein RodA